MKIIKNFFTGLAIVLAIMWIYLYPFHRIMAEIKFAQYIEERFKLIHLRKRKG